MNKIIKYLFLTVFIFMIQANSFAAIKSKIVATVGENIVTSYDIENQIKLILFLSKQELSQQNINSTKREAFNNLVRFYIKKNELEKYDVKLEKDEQLDNFLVKVSKQLSIEKINLKKIFEANNINYEFFILQNIVEVKWKSLIFSIYKKQIQVNDSEIEAELNIVSTSKEESIQYKLSEIEITKESYKQKLIMDKIYKSINEIGFSATAKIYSISTSKDIGGELGWVNRKSLSNVFANEIASLKIGQISKPIKSTNSLIIFKLNNKKENTNISSSTEERKKMILNNKIQAKLNLFSRSHFATLENSIFIKTYE